VDPPPRLQLEVVNEVLFREEGFQGTLALDRPESLSLAALLKSKRGTCVTLVILYLAVASRAGVEAHAAATPVHLFVRHEGAGGALNVETLEGGRFVEEETYRSRYQVAEESVRNGAFLRPLPDRAVLAHLLNNRAVLAAAAGRHRAAMRDFGRALGLFPDLAAAHYNRGLQRLKRGDFEEARADLTRAVEIHPLDAEALNNRGLAHLEMGDVRAATRDFEEALRIRPGLREAAENLRRVRTGAAGDR
jgi:regulator of sirC expression with transglutaminase-like and TPR domain